METIRSGTTTERLLRAAMVAVLCYVTGGMFLWDGFHRYAQKNVEQLVKSLGLPTDPMPLIDAKLTPELGRDWAARITGDAPESQGAETLGEAALVNGDDAYYLGPAGHIKVRRKLGKFASAEWVDGPTHTATDLQYQRWIGYALGTVGLIFLVQLLRVALTRASLSDAGLQIRGVALISFEAMSGIRDKRKVGGSIELEYRQDDRTHTVELDSYIFKERDALVVAICRQKGFENPLRRDETTRPA